MDNVLDKKLQQNYEAGFTTDVQSETLPPGLDEDTIRKTVSYTHLTLLTNREV